MGVDIAIGPVFLSEDAILALHEDLAAEHGTRVGHQLELVQSVAAYPRQKYSWAEPVPSIPELAAALGFAAAKFHAFLDGNKRVALAAMDLFLGQNEFELTSSQWENVEVILALAAGEIGEDDLIRWVVDNCAAFHFE
ncbi:MAG: type II toxin-antitoxin system death-on-curing family toxin [Tahibacter sp.]